MDKKEQKQMTAGKEIIPEKAVQKEETKQESAPEIILQYREYEASIDAVTDRVKSHYYAKGHAHGSIESIQIYVKPEDFTAYYVINDGVVGKVNLFWQEEYRNEDVVVKLFASFMAIRVWPL